MTTLTDSKNTKWDLTITIATAKKLRANNFDIMDIESFLVSLNDIFDVYEILWLIVEEQAEKLGIDALEFANRYEDVAQDMYERLVEAVVNFFQNRGKMAAAKSLKTMHQVTIAREKKALSLLEKKSTAQMFEKALDQDLKKAEAELRKISGETSTSTQESSD